MGSTVVSGIKITVSIMYSTMVSGIEITETN